MAGCEFSGSLIEVLELLFVRHVLFQMGEATVVYENLAVVDKDQLNGYSISERSDYSEKYKYSKY